jgi:hypothetical protein
MGESPVMTLRERALKVLRGEAPDVVPWFGDLDYWATALIGRGLKPDGFKTSPEYVDWHRELRVGFYLQGYFPYRMVFPDIRIEQWHEGPDRVRRLETPSGVLRERWRWLADSFAEAPVEHLVKTAEDMPAYAWLYRNLCYEPDHRLALERLGYVGGQGLVLAYLPKSPLMQMIALDAGIEAVVNILADDPAALADALEAVGESHTRAAEIAVASPAEVLMIPENLSSEVVGLDGAHPRSGQDLLRSPGRDPAGAVVPGRFGRVRFHRGHDPGSRGRRPRLRMGVSRGLEPDGPLGRASRRLLHASDRGGRVRAALPRGARRHAPRAALRPRRGRPGSPRRAGVESAPGGGLGRAIRPLLSPKAGVS